MRDKGIVSCQSSSHSTESVVMEIITKGSEVVTENVNTERKFGVKDLGMVLHILRDKLYSNKIGSIAREVMSNARDAHREAGKGNVPIEVVVPSSLSPQFIVRDFGPGISPDRMENVFLNYAESTKRGDNIQTGGFGLGAKTPFAYTDNFHINTIAMEGDVKVKRCYVAYIDESRCGACVEVEKTIIEDVNVSTGTEICITLLSDNVYNDVRSFRDEAKNVGKYWKVQPNFLGFSEHEILEYKNSVEKMNSGKSVMFSNLDATKDELKNIEWAIHNDRTYSSTHSAILDGIHYPIPQEMLEGVRHEIAKFSDSIRFVLGFNVGELTPTVSREALEVSSKKNREIISNRVSSILNEFNSNIVEKIKNSETYFDAITAAQNYISILSWNQRQHFTLENFTWNDRPLTNTVVQVDAFEGVANRSKVRSISSLPFHKNAVYIQIEDTFTPTKFHDSKFRELHPEHAQTDIYFYRAYSVAKITKYIDIAWLPNHFYGSTMFRSRKSPVSADFLSRISLYKFVGYKFERVSVKEYIADKGRKVYTKLRVGDYNNEKEIVLENNGRIRNFDIVRKLLAEKQATLYGVYSKDVLDYSRVKEKMSDAEYLSDFIVEETLKTYPNFLEEFVISRTVTNEDSITNIDVKTAKKFVENNLGTLFETFIKVSENQAALKDKINKVISDQSIFSFIEDKKITYPTLAENVVNDYSTNLVEKQIIAMYPMLKIIGYIHKDSADFNIVVDYISSINNKISGQS